MTTLSDIGKGHLGVGARLRSFEDLLDESATQKDVVCVLKPVREVTSDWSVDDGDTYVTGYEWVFDNIRRDVVGAKTEDETLTRAETLVLCRANAGTFFYDVDEDLGTVAKWDDVSNFWQIPCWAPDGVNDYWTRGAELTGGADGKKGSVSFWFKAPEDIPTAGEVLFGNDKFFGFLWTSGKFQITGKNAAGDNKLEMYTTASICDGQWHHIMASWDLGATTAVMYLDGVLQTTATELDDTLDYTTGNWAIGAQVAGTLKFKNDFGQLWFTPDYIDMTIQAVRDLFYNSTTSKPVDDIGGGTDIDGVFTYSGTTYTPIVYLIDDDPGINAGTGGDFTDQGSTVEADSTPNHPTGSIKWDQFPKLYVHLTDGSDPTDNTVVAVHYFPFSTKGVSHPHIGETELTTDGIFETWSDVNTPTNWSLQPAQADRTVITRESTSVKNGTYSLSFVADGSETKTSNYVGQTVALQTDSYYRLSGWYRWEPDDANDNVSYRLWPYIKVRNSVDSTKSVGIDGRTNSNNDVHRIDKFKPTPNKWFRFFFDFLTFDDLVATSARLELSCGHELGTKGKIIFDDIRIRRVWSWDYHEPRLLESSIPNIDTGSRDIFFGGKEIGIGSVKLVNSEGFLERLIGECEWMNAECIVDIGGTWNDGDYEVPRDNFFRGFTGLIQGLDVDDDKAIFDIQDQRAFFHMDLPPRYYDDNDFPNMDTTNFQGKPRPLFFGVKNNITPARIDYGSSSDYGKYEICDTDRAPNGMKAISEIYAYVDETAAGERRSDLRIELTTGTDYTEDLANGQFTIITDVGPYVIDDSNNYLDFKEGGAELNAVLTLGLYTADDLAAEIETQLEAVGAADFTVTYSDTTHKFTIASDGGSLALLCKTGTNKKISIWKTIGFKESADRATTSEVGDNPTFVNADTDHVLRTNAQGFKDDASGTYTGSANALIEVGADILAVILVKYMVKPSTIIDTASFALARSRGAESLSIYMNSPISTREIFERLEFSNIANIIINGEGKVFYNIYVGEVPTNITLLHNRDFKSFKSGKKIDEVFTTIRVLFDKDPTIGNYRSRETTDNSVRVRLGRPDTKDFETFLKLADSAINCSVRYSVLSGAAARKISGTGIGSKLMKLEVGDKVKVTRRRAIALGGEIINRVFRLLSLSKDPLGGTVDFSATDDQVTVANQACIGTCQAFCQGGNCQETCMQSCQEDCKQPGNCQDLCEGTCQGDPCQVVDQDCVINCQDACELGNCQAVCELVTQGCPGCQTNCETGPCQDACELVPCQTCQNACQAGSVCMNDCEEGVSCQDSCQTGSTCEDPCEEPGNCQDTCELTPCQGGCQAGSCESYCEGDCQQVDEEPTV
jgi:hypothetical protein